MTQTINGFYDQMVKASQKSCVNRMTFMALSRKGRTELIQSVLLALMTPAFTQIVDARDRAIVHLETTRLAFALEAYKRATGTFPEQLKLLAPNYVDVMPQDPFVDSSFRYILRDTRYHLYSVGANGRDEGGRPFDVVNSDDLSVHSPLVK